MSIVSTSLKILLVGFTAKRTTTGWPEEIPPRIPPAWLDKNSGVLWEMSEIFNVVILNLPQFRSILGMEEKLFYSELQEQLIEARGMWNSSRKVGGFVDKYLEIYSK